MSNTFRAAYIPDTGSIGVGTLLTTESESGLSDDALMQAALVVLDQVNANLDAIDEPKIRAGQIVIGEWTE